MTKSTLIAALALCLAAPTFAEPVELTSAESAETRFGTLSVVASDFDGIDGQQVQLNGTDIAGLEDVYAGIEGVWPSGDADYALVSLAGGGNACPVFYRFLKLTAQGATASDVVGTCSEGVLDLRLTETGIEADIASFDPSLEYETFAWDGAVVTATAVKRTTEGVTAAGGGDQATRWLGEHPATPFDEAAERLRFQTIMTEEQVYDLVARVTVASETYESDGFVVGDGFDPAAGGDISGMWGIRISDGAPFAIFRDTGQPNVIFGMGEEDLPTAAVLFLQGIAQ
jgi:hypothetical protein